MSISRSNHDYINLLRSKEQIAVCDITGITITLNIPSIPHIALSYTNPLADINNTKDIAARKAEDLLKLPSDVLSAIILSLLQSYNLKGCKTPAVQANINLQRCHKIYLIDLIKILNLVNKRNAIHLPLLSLDIIEDERYKHLAFKDVIINYAASCKDILNPKPSINDYRNKDVIWSKEEKQKSIIGLSIEQKREGKNILNDMLFAGEITEKFYSLMKTILQKDNFLETAQELKDKIIDKLDILDSENSNKLADIFSTSVKNQKTEEIFEDAISSTMPNLGTKMSLKDILASKIKPNNILPSVARELAHPLNESNQDNLESSEQIENQIEEDNEDNSDEF